MSYHTQPLVSIVTPMYNEQEHLSECIESVLRQTYQNWEYIIFDNCSTDGSCEIARRYAREDPRIRLCENKEFLRAVPNHNAALRQISPASKYCKIVFGDDWLFPECVERMVALAEAHPSVGLVGAYGLEGQQVVWVGLPYPSTVVPGFEICRRLFLDDFYVFGTGTSLLYRADLVRNRDPFYNEDDFHADMEVCIALLKSCDFGFVHQVLSFTRVRQHSLMTMARNMNTKAASALQHLVTHGPHFLTEKELHSCLRRSLDEYYRYLAGSFLRRRPTTFWDHHRKALAEAGVGLRRARLARAVVARLCSAALNPKDTIQTLLRARADEEKVFIREVVHPPQGESTLPI